MVVARASGAPTSAGRARRRPTAPCRPRSSTTRSTPTTTARRTAPRSCCAICRYHRDTNGWRDIGYNFLVDRYGQIFEGRAGGIDQAVIGAQAQGYNAVSTGVANIGTFTSAAPSDRRAAARSRELLAWKLSLHGVPVDGPGRPCSRRRPDEPLPGRHAGDVRAHLRATATPTARPARATRSTPSCPRSAGATARLAPELPPPPPAGRAVTLAAADATLDYPQPAQLSGAALSADGAPLAARAGRRSRSPRARAS